MSTYKFSQQQFARLADEKNGGDPATYMEISQKKAIGVDPTDDDVVYVDPDKLGQAFRNVLADYAKRNGIPSVTGAVVVPPATAPARQEDSLSKMQRERREALAAEHADADACVREWMAAGLLQSRHNDELLNRWHEANPQAPWSRSSINAMIRGLMSQLQWTIWSPHAQGAKAPEPVVEATPEPAGLPYTREQLVRKLRGMSAEDRYSFFSGGRSKP